MITFSTNFGQPPKSLLDACTSQALTAVSQSALTAQIVIFEASGRPAGTLNSQQVLELTDHIRTGGRLLLTSQQSPGLVPVQLGGILPSTGWGTQLRLSPYTPEKPIGIRAIDTAFFANGLEGLLVPFCHDIRPTSAAERGQARYERYNFVHLWLKSPIAAGSDYWSRSLLNREWIVRAQCNDLAKMPLVVTGRYGAGKVVMVGTSAAGIGDGATAGLFWISVLRWLQEQQAVDQTISSALTKPDLRVSFARSAARITLHNPNAAALPVQVITRALAESGAILADGFGELQRSVELAPYSSSSLVLPLNGTFSPENEAGQGDRPIQLRVGILSADGSSLLAEKRVTSPPAPLQIKIETDNLRGLPYSFRAPGPDALVQFQGRMGTFVGAYAYHPGDLVSGSIIIKSGVTNLAPLSSIRDLTSLDNRSVIALNDRASAARLGPNTDKIEGFGMWTGKKSTENILEFTLPQNSLIMAIVLIGGFGAVGNADAHNPGRAVIEADHQQIALSENLDTMFQSGHGQARIAFSPRRANTLTIHFPWSQKLGQRDRQEPWLGEIYVEGWCYDPAPSASGQLVVELVNALTRTRKPVLSMPLALSGNQSQKVLYKVALPEEKGIHFYRLEAAFQHVTASTPVMTITPARTLLPLADVRPTNAPGVGMNVSRGFREVSRVGTGTAELIAGWGMPDDLVWAYSRQLKEISSKARTEASRLYLTETDLRHYITPWRSFSNGQLFLPTTAPQIVEGIRKSGRWSKSDIALLMFADRWDTGPDMSSLHGWQDYVEFDKWLRSSGQSELQAQTLVEVGAEIEARFASAWQGWQLARYIQSVRSLRDSFKSAGKSLVISAQGVPMVAGDPGRELSLTIRGCNDDCTWGMLDNSPVFTTGRQLCEMAFNPVWQMSTLSPWGFNSSLFNDWQWHNPVGTTEPSRRHMYNRAWRATLWAGGEYASVHTYGYSSNVGIAFTMGEDDYQQWWYTQERHSLIAPEAPIGAGLVISTKKAADPKHLRFNCGDPLVIDEARVLTVAFRALHDAGISLSFVANAANLGDFASSAPLILLNLPDFSDEEVTMLQSLHARGTRIAAFADRASLSAAASALFSQTGTLLLAGSAATLVHAEAVIAAAALQRALALPLLLPKGTAGYAFRSQNLSLIVVEDWLEKGRHVDVRIAKSKHARTASACNVNNHQTLDLRDEESNWVIQVPLRSGDGILIALQES